MTGIQLLARALDPQLTNCVVCTANRKDYGEYTRHRKSIRDVPPKLHNRTLPLLGFSAGRNLANRGLVVSLSLSCCAPIPTSFSKST